MSNPNPVLPESNTGKTYRSMKVNIKADMFANFYLSPVSPTFMNVRQSAMRAGYTEHYANNITVQRPKWWVELTETADYKRAKMLAVAETNLLDSVTNNSEDREDKKIKHDATKFITERLGKDKYSTRQEVTGADGRRLFDNKTREDASTPVAALFKGVHDPNAQ